VIAGKTMIGGSPFKHKKTERMEATGYNTAKRISVNQQPDMRVCVGKSGVEGQGLFAREDIPAGEQLFTITGRFIDHNYAQDFSHRGPNWIGAGANRWIIPDNDSPVIYMNHSCKPNCYINEEFGIVAAVPLRAGEELFLDYSTTEIDPYWELDCVCNLENCRKKIRAFQHLPKSLQLKYLRFIPMRLFNFMPKKVN
jgi:uncharacterized protein